MTRTVLLALTVAIGLGLAQQPLKTGEPFEADLTAARWFTLGLSAGDYVHGSIEIHPKDAKINLKVYLPDGVFYRAYEATAEQPFAFVAETPGAYRLELAPPGSTPIKVRLILKEILSVEERLKPAPPADKNVSPRIEALRKQLAAGERDTEAFWREVAAKATPLVEAIEKEPKYQLVTFLYRGNGATRNVVVEGSFRLANAKPADNVLRQLDGTDIWYATLRFPAGARFYYNLSVNDGVSTSPGHGPQRMATSRRDPLNPNGWFCKPDSTPFDCASLAELPGAPPQPWIVRNPTTPAGAVNKHTIKSELLKNERKLSIYTPPGYSKENTKPYALLVVFDESAYLDLVPTPTILDNLIAARKIPEMVAVLIANPSPETRGKELPPNPDFADFLAKELIPFVHAQYNVTSDPQLTVVAGSSYGGIASVYAGLRHPEVFGRILCQSGSFWWAPDHPYSSDVSTETGWLAKEFIKSPKLPLAFYMDAGQFEIDTGGFGGGILEPSRHMRDVLLAKGYPVTYQQFIGGHDYLSWRGTLADGLIALIGR